MPDRQGIARHAAIAGALSALSDDRLGQLVADVPVIGFGIGGTSSIVHIDGTPVFLKRIPLTDLERKAEHQRSTANLFGLPPFCQYGVGGPGFGAWRELAAHLMTTSWVLDARCSRFPTLYYWRTMPGRLPTPEEHADLDQVVAYWHGSTAVAERLAASAASSAHLALFLEYVPHSVPDWLASQHAGGDQMLACAVSMMEQELLSAISCMNGAGLMHFDAHLGNLRTDGQRIYVTDFGLATSTGFNLSEAETAFLRRNASHDACHVMSQFVNWLTTALTGTTDPAERNERIRRYAAGEPPPFSPPEAAAIVERYAPVAAVMNGFYWQLHLESRMTPYPADELRHACAASGLPVPALPR